MFLFSKTWWRFGELAFLGRSCFLSAGVLAMRARQVMAAVPHGRYYTATMTDSTWITVRGQDVPIELLRRSAARERLAHGYAFFGPKGVGRRLVAQKLAKSLFCTEIPDNDTDACGHCSSCKQVEAGNHPDLLMIQKPAGKRDFPIELIAGPPERRGREGLCYELAMRPMSAERRIAIVDDAETMNAESANALLKTLEEPPPGSLIVLLATGPESILPTIRSRVQPLHFASLPANDVAELLCQADSEITAAEAREAADLANGSLETARQLLDRDLRNLRSQAVGIFERMPFNAVEASTRLQKSLDDLGGDAATKRNQADWAFRFIVEFLRSRLIAAAGSSTEPFERTLPNDDDARSERLGLAIERVVAAERAVAEMTPVALAIEGLCDDLAAILRGADRPVLAARGF